MKMLSTTISTFILHNKKNILIFFVVLVIIVLLFCKIGIITPTEDYYKWYFKTNYSDFESIVDYVSENDLSVNITSLCETSIIENDNIKNKIIKIMVCGDFEAITGYSESLTFRCNNLFDSKGEPIAIVYSLNHSEDVWSDLTWGPGDSYIRYGYTYKKIASNWYYEFRSH